MDVFTADIDVAAAQALSPPTNVVKRYRGSFRFPSWSPDGTRLSFMSSLDGPPRIGIYSGETKDLDIVIPHLASFFRPQWDPSGRGLLVTGADRQGQHGVFRVDLSTGDSKLVINSKVLDGMEGVWARDGRTLYDRFSDPKAGLFKLDVRTGQRQTLFVPAPGSDLGLENLALSPDEQMLAFQVRQQDAGTGTLMVIPTSGGSARALLTIAKPEQFPFGSFAWKSDSTHILAVRSRARKSELWLVPVGSGSPRKVEFPSMPITQLRMNPSGHRIAFTSGELSGEIWLAENLLSRE